MQYLVPSSKPPKKSTSNTGTTPQPQSIETVKGLSSLSPVFVPQDTHYHPTIKPDLSHPVAHSPFPVIKRGQVDQSPVGLTHQMNSLSLQIPKEEKGVIEYKNYLDKKKKYWN